VVNLSGEGYAALRAQEEVANAYRTKYGTLNQGFQHRFIVVGQQGIIENDWESLGPRGRT